MRDRDTINDFKRRHSDPFALAAMVGRLKGSKRTSRGPVILCPWHDERSPSCSLFAGSPGVGVHCFGCGKTSDEIGLVAACHGLDERRDLRRVLELGGVTVATTYVAPPAEPMVSGGMFDRIGRAVLAACPISGQAETYLRARGIVDDARRANWGSLPESFAGQRQLAEKIRDLVGDDAWRASGFASNDGNGFAFARHTLLIPYYGTGSDPLLGTLQRRRLDAGEPKYVFPRGRSVPAWPFGSEVLEELGSDTAIVFAEGAIDALTLRRRYREQDLDRAVLAIPSASTWRTTWATLAAGRDVVIATDNDDAGNAVADRMVVDLYEAGAKTVGRAVPEHGKDWNSEVAA